MKIMFWMQATGTVLRFISSFLWCQMYRLGAVVDLLVTTQQTTVDLDGTTPANAGSGNGERGSEVLGGSIYASLCGSFSRRDDLGVEVSIKAIHLIIESAAEVFLRTSQQSFPPPPYDCFLKG